MTNTYLQFDIIIEGDVSTSIKRRDQDFNDLYNYLFDKYPNVLVPFIDKNSDAKKFTD